MVLLILYLLVVAICLISGRSKILFVISFLFAWLLIAGNYDNADYNQYLIRYERGMEVIVDFGFSALCTLFSDLGYDYQTFKAIVSFFCLLLVYSSISKLCKTPSKGAAFFLIFPFIVDITQFRNFVSYSFVFFAVPYLFKDGFKNTIKYVIIVLAASTIHTTSLFYLLFILTRYRLKKWHVFALIVGVFIAKEAIKLYMALAFETDKLDFFDKPSIAGALFSSFIIILNCYVVWFVFKKRKNIPSRGSDLPSMFCSETTWLYCNLLLLVVIPFLFDNGNYIRIFRNVVLLNMIFIYNSPYLKRELKFSLICGYLVYFTYTTYFSGTYFSDVFMPVFNNNSIL